jgi:hypothetical protein
MSEPPTDDEELQKKTRLTDERLLTEPANLRKMTRMPREAAPILQEAYKKHAAELASIEDRQHKLTLLMLGIFSAGASLIASGHVDMSCGLRWALTGFSLAVAIPSFHYNSELHRLRGVTRELLVRCELALGFHEKGLFLKDEKLYAEGEIAYGKKGRWVRDSYCWTVGAVCVAFIFVVWLMPNPAVPKAPVPPALAVTCAPSPSNSPSR